MYVGRVPIEPPKDFRNPEEFAKIQTDYERYHLAKENSPDRRRYPLDTTAFHAMAELDIVGGRTEFSDHIVLIDGEERRFSDHDHRLMVEHGIVPKDTVLIAGIIFRETSS